MNGKDLESLKFLLGHPEVLTDGANELKNIAGHIAKVSINDTDDMKCQSLTYIQDLHLIADHLDLLARCCDCLTALFKSHGEG